MVEAAEVRGHETPDEDVLNRELKKTKKKKQQLFQKRWTPRVIRADLVRLSADALFVSCVCLCVMHVWRKCWQLPCVNVSCCSAIQANAQPG